MKQSNFNAATWSGPARGGGAARAIGKQPKGHLFRERQSTRHGRGQEGVGLGLAWVVVHVLCALAFSFSGLSLKVVYEMKILARRRQRRGGGALMNLKW